MLYNYLTLAIRLLVRNPFFTAINLLCLSVGFAMFFMLWQHSENELHSDQFHKDAERIYRPGVEWNWTDDGTKWQQAMYSGLSAQGAYEIFHSFGDFDDVVNLFPQGNFVAPNFGHRNDIYLTKINSDHEKISFIETNVAYADSNLFNFFTIPLIEGDANTVLKEMRATVLSESMSRKYFNNESPVGKVLYLNDTIPLMISGIFKDLPSNTHLNFSIVISATGLNLERYQAFQISHSYFKLKRGVRIEDLEIKFRGFIKKVLGPMEDQQKGKLRIETFIQQLKDIPFASLTGDHFIAKSRHFLLMVSILSFVILIMAWINYVNLARANYQKRLRELGARKSVGATSADFAMQFLVESALTNLIALMAAITVVQLAKGPAELLFQFHVPSLHEIAWTSWVVVIGVVILGIVTTGLYPALSAIHASSKVLLGAYKKSDGKDSFTKVLTTLQYVFAIVLVGWVTAIGLQLDFIFTKNIGINKENVLVIDLPFKRNKLFNTSLGYLKGEISRLHGVAGLTTSVTVVGDAFIQGHSIKRKGGFTNPAVDTNGGVDDNFIPFYNIKLIAGRNFVQENKSDEHAIIISRLAASRAGFDKPEDALGVELEEPNARVIGVIEDYDVNPLFSELQSAVHARRGLALTLGSELRGQAVNKLSVKVDIVDINGTMKQLQEVYHDAFPEYPFQSYFLDEHVNQYYKGERVFSQQMSLFAGIAIFIACLGLLGMMRIKVVEYAKDIAIRKVLGARLSQIGTLLIRPSVYQMAIAAVVGLPIAYKLNTAYLEKFTERISLNWWHYLTTVVIFVMLLLVSISVVVISAARANPVDDLHHD